MEANEVGRKRCRIILALGIVLCSGSVLGDFGSIAGMLYYLDHAENLRARTPGDATTSIFLSLFGMVAGLAASVAGVLVVVWSCTKLGRLRNETELGAR